MSLLSLYYVFLYLPVLDLGNLELSKTDIGLS